MGVDYPSEVADARRARDKAQAVWAEAERSVVRAALVARAFSTNKRGAYINLAQFKRSRQEALAALAVAQERLQAAEKSQAS
jgi:hypothetical protein